MIIQTYVNLCYFIFKCNFEISTAFKLFSLNCSNNHVMSYIDIFNVR